MFLVFLLESFPASGEHLPKAEQFSPEATNYSYHLKYSSQLHEFDISEKAFLEMCEEKGWEPVVVETLPDLPPFDHEKPSPRINYLREVPLTIVRYVNLKEREKHKGCDPWNSAKCNVDPSGKTNASCFRSVSQGYYYERRYDNGGGIFVLYDSENGRCYTYSNPR